MFNVSSHIWIEKQEFKLINIRKQNKKRLLMMMFQKNINKHSLDWLKMSNYPHRVLIVEGSGFRKTKELINLINEQSDDNYSVIKFIYILKVQTKQNIKFLLTNIKTLVLKIWKIQKAFIHFSNNMQDALLIDDRVSNNKLSPIVTELIIRKWKVNISKTLYKEILHPAES